MDAWSTRLNSTFLFHLIDNEDIPRSIAKTKRKKEEIGRLSNKWIFFEEPPSGEILSKASTASIFASYFRMPSDNNAFSHECAHVSILHALQPIAVLIPISKGKKHSHVYVFQLPDHIHRWIAENKNRVDVLIEFFISHQIIIPHSKLESHKDWKICLFSSSIHIRNRTKYAFHTEYMNDAKSEEILNWKNRKLQILIKATYTKFAQITHSYSGSTIPCDLTERLLSNHSLVSCILQDKEAAATGKKKGIIPLSLS